MLLLEDDLRLDHFDLERVNDERYDFLDNHVRADVGTFVGETTLLDLGGFWDVHREHFDPVFRYSSAGGEVSLDRQLSDYRNLWTSLEVRRTTFEALPLSDHDQTRLAVGYFRYFPETLRLESIPLPVELPRKNRDSFEYAGDLEMNRTRRHALDLGAGQIARASREPEPVPIHRRMFRDHVDRREMAYGLTLAGTRRDADAGGGASFSRATAVAFGRAAPRDDVVWTLEDQVDTTWRDAEDASRWLLDQVDNRVSLERTRMGKRAMDLTRGSVETTVTGNFQSVNTNRLVLEQYSYRHFGRRYGYTTWLKGTMRLNRSPALDYQDREGLRSGNTFTIEFSPRFSLDLSLLYERVAVQGLQTEFDSTYAQRTYDLRFKRELSPKARVEYGYRQERERHQAFSQNNRDEDTFFLDLVADL
ncbi:MAG: hypothetical protein HY814_01185 [Candidatus Riflebacteria bacterium]|nr:hypothetical protein [Candidatus Riflebacteria bacterium]